VRVKVFTTSATNFREAWVACPSGYTAISASAQRNATTVTFRWEPGTMTGSDAQSATAGGAPPAGTTFTASANGASSPNGYHVTNSAVINTTRLILICIPN
jgi:hypothetical protein